MKRTAYYDKDKIPICLVNTDFEDNFEYGWEIQPSENDSFSGASGNQKVSIVQPTYPNYATKIFKIMAPTTTLSPLNFRVWLEDVSQFTDVTSTTMIEKKEIDKIQYYSFMIDINYKNEELDAKELIYDLKQFI